MLHSGWMLRSVATMSQVAPMAAMELVNVLSMSRTTAPVVSVEIDIAVAREFRALLGEALVLACGCCCCCYYRRQNMQN